MAPFILDYKFTQNYESKHQKTNLTALNSVRKREVKVLGHYAENWRPLTQQDLVDVFARFVSRILPKNRRNLHFHEKRPGIAFWRAFGSRNSYFMAFQTAPEGDAARYRATNESVLAKHFFKLNAFITEQNIDAKQIINADETGISACKSVERKGRDVCTTRSHNLLKFAASFQILIA